MFWFNSKPQSDFTEKDAEKTISLLSLLSAFGIVVEKQNHELSLYLGVDKEESHHITSLQDISSVSLGDGIMPDISFEDTTLMKLKNSYIHPLCTSVIPCKIFEQSNALPDFVFGIVGSRVNTNIIRRKARSFLESSHQSSKKRGTSQKKDITNPVEAKLEEDTFFLSSVFFSCAKNDTRSFLSSVNFTNKLSGSNALIPERKPKSVESVLAVAPKTPLFGIGGKTPVLSVVEIASVLSFPSTMFGLEMQSGTTRTFSSTSSDIDDPADFFME